MVEKRRDKWLKPTFYKNHRIDIRYFYDKYLEDFAWKPYINKKKFGDNYVSYIGKAEAVSFAKSFIDEQVYDT